MNFVVVSSRAPTGPRAWTREVETPISAPMPNWPPSTSRVEAFTSTAAASTSRVKRRACSRSLVTIASASPVPCRRMCARAASRSSTTRTARIRSRYSVSQSASVAGRAAGTSARVAGQPRSSTPASASRRAASGRNVGAIARWTRSVSSALQTLGRWAFAFTTICAAIAGSAEASTKTWTRPLSCLSTGTRERSATHRTKSSPPRGMTRSRSPSSSRSAATAARSVVSTNWIASAGPPAFSSALASTPAISVLDSIASLHDGVAGLHAEPGGVGRDVRARLVDERDDAQRDADAGDLEAVRPAPRLDDHPHGVRERGDLAEPLRHLLDAGLAERQAVEERARGAAAPGALDVAAVRFEERRGLLDEPVRHLEERVVLDAGRAERERARGLARRAGLPFHERPDVHGHPLEDYQIIAVDHFVEALVAEPRLDLAGLGALDLPELLGVEVHHAARELAAPSALHRHHLARGEVALDGDDPRREQALLVPGQRRERPRVHREPALRGHRERDPAR